jgi:hypothetical protein
LLVEGRQPPQRDVHRAPTATQPGSGVGRGSGQTPAIPSGAPAAADWQTDSPMPRQASPRLPFETRTPPNGNDYMGPPRGASPSVRPESEPGSRPLVDEKMGWQTGQSPIYAGAPDGTATRVPTRYGDSDISVVSRRGWIVFVLLMLVGLGTGLLIALHGS